MDAADYEDILEWSWVDDIVMYEDGTKIDVVASLSSQNSDMCVHYSMRDALKSRKNIFEISCEEQDSSYFFEFGDDISVHHLMDAVPRSRTSYTQLWNFVRNPGVTTDRCYELALQVPSKCVKDLKGCRRIQVEGWKWYSAFGGFTNQKVMAIAEDLEEYGPAFGYFACAPTLKEQLSKQFIYKRGDSVHQTKSHAVLLTGFGRAREKKSQEVIHYWKIQNNWGNTCPVARISVQAFAEVYCPKFRNSVELTSSERLEVIAEEKAARRLVFADYEM